VPVGTLAVPHAPATQVAVMHSPAGGGQSAGVVQTLVAPPAPPVPVAALLLVAPPAPPVPVAVALEVAPPLPPIPVDPPDPPAPPAPVLVELTAEVTVEVSPLPPLPPDPPDPLVVGLELQPAPPTKTAAVNQRTGSRDARMNHPAAKENIAGDRRASAGETSDETPGASTLRQRSRAALRRCAGPRRRVTASSRWSSSAAQRASS